MHGELNKEMKLAGIKLTKTLIGWKKNSIAIFFICIGFIIYICTSSYEGFIPEFFHHFGLFVATVIAVHFTYDIFIKKQEIENMKEEISNAIATTLNEILPSYEKWGFKGFEDILEYNSIFENLKKGDELLWLDTYAPSRIEVMSLISAAVSDGVKIKMLVIAPESDMAKLRAKEIKQHGFDANYFLTELRLFVDSLLKVLEIVNIHNPGLLEVSAYYDLPCIPMYIHRRDKVPLRGFTSYFLSGGSEKFVHSKWCFSENGMLKYFVEYFEEKWSKAKPLSCKYETGLLDFVRSSKTIRVGALYWKPVVDCVLVKSSDENGEHTYEPSGFYGKWLKKVAEKNDLRIICTPFSWSSIKDQLINGNIDLVISAFITETRKEYADFSKPYHQCDMYGVAKKGDKEWEVDDVNSENTIVVVAKNEVGYEYVKSMNTSLESIDTRFTIVNTARIEEVASIVLGSKEENYIAISDALSINALVKENGDKLRVVLNSPSLGSHPLALMFPKGQSAFKKWIENEFDIVRKDPEIKEAEHELMNEPGLKAFFRKI